MIYLSEITLASAIEREKFKTMEEAETYFVTKYPDIYFSRSIISKVCEIKELSPYITLQIQKKRQNVKNRKNALYESAEVHIPFVLKRKMCHLLSSFGFSDAQIAEVLEVDEYTVTYYLQNKRFEAITNKKEFSTELMNEKVKKKTFSF